MKQVLHLCSKIRGYFSASQGNDVGYDCRLTVGSPSFHRRSTMLKLVSVLVLILTVGVGSAWGTTYTYTPGGTYTASGGTSTISGVQWTYSSATYCSLNSSKIQIGSKNNPQTSNWTIQTAISNFGSGKKVTAISLTAYTTATTATYDISAGGASVKSGSLTASSNTYTASSLNVTSGNIVITMKGSNSSKAMYLCGISVTYEDAGGGCDKTVTLSYDGDGASHGEFVLKAGSASGSTISEGGTVANCGSGTTVVALCPQNVDAHWHLEASNITATNKTGSITSDGNGNFLISYTQGSNVSSSVSVTFTEDTHYTVTWMSNGSQHTTTEVYSGEKPTFPSNPSSCDGTSTAFYGWATSTWTGKLDDVSAKTIYLSGDAMPAVSASGTIYHAVFAKESATAFEKITSADNVYVGQKLAIVSNKQDYILPSNFNATTAAAHPNSNDNKLTVTSSQVWTITDIDEYGYYKLKNSTTQMGVNRTSGLTSGSAAVGNYSTVASWWAINETTDFDYTVDDCFYMYNWATETYYNFLENSGSAWLSYYATDITSGNKVWYAMKLYQPERSEYLTTCCTKLGSINGSISLTQLATPDPTKLKATWMMNASTGISSYNLEVYNSSDVLVKTINGYTSGSEITGLTPCTTYYVKLYTVSSGGEYCDGGLISTSSTCATNGYTLTVNKTNVSLSSGSEPSNICSNVSATYSAGVGYNLPTSITVTNAGAENTGWTWNSSTGALTINKANVTGNVTVTITGVAEGCSGKYTFAYGATANADGKNIDGATKLCFEQVSTTDEFQVTGFTIPTTTQYYWVGYNGYFYDGSLGTNGAKSSRNQFKYLPVANLQGSSCGGTGDSYKHAAAGAYGLLRIYRNYSDNNLYVGFSPAGYQMRIGSGDSWTNVQLTQDGSTWTSDLVTLDAATVAKKYYINVWTGSSYSSSDAGVAINNWTDGNSAISSMVFKTGADTWNTTSGLSAGMRGKFRTWTDNCANNGYCHFVPYYRVTYDGSGASGSTDPSADVSCEGDDAARTVVAAANGFTVPTGKSFGGWASSPENAAAGTVAYAAGADVVLTQSIVLYAIWTDIDYTVTVNQSPDVSATTTGQTSSAHYNGTINLTTTIPDGYRFVNWTSSDVTITTPTSATTASFTMPAKNVTVTANFQQTHTVSWKSNGADYVSPVTYDHGAALALPAGTPSAPSGCSDKVFVGWTSDPEISTETSTKPTIISAGGAVETDATYRAVFADQVGDPDHFKRVTQLSDITVGGEIVFGFYVTSNTKLCGLDFSGWTTYSCATGVDETSNKIPVPSDANIWTVSKESGYWVFTNKGDGTTKMATSSSSSNNELDPETQTYYKWNIGASSSGINNFYVQLYNGGSLTNCALELYESTWKIYAPSTGSGGSKTYTYASNAYTALKLYVPAGSEDNYITLCSTCTTPSDVTASGITTDGATITWNGTSQENNGGSGTGFVVKYGTNSTRDENSNTINVAAGTNTADLTGLAQGTKYYVWVQSKCDNSWSTTPAEFTTLVSHTATFIGADGSTLQSSAIVEGESVTYSGSTPVSCDTGDGASTTFVGWATDTWTGKKAAKGSIVPTFIDIAGGESLPAMSTSDVTYHAVFAKSSGTPLTNHAWTYTFTAQTFKSDGTKTLAGTDGDDAVNADWELLTYNQSSATITNWGSYDSDRGSKIGKNDDDYVTYMYLSSESFDGTVTAVKISTSGNSGVSANVSATVGGTSFLNNSSSSVNISSSNTEYSFIGSKAISGEDEIMFIWEQESAKALYIKKIEIDYTTGGDVSYSNYMTTCSQCVTPNSVTADAITEAGATINWAGTSKTGTTGFTVLWGTDGTRANNSNSANVDADTKTYSITGLSAGTTYYVWVQSRCDGSWSDRISFTTKAIHTISFSADNGTISSGATIDIVNGETLTFPSVTSTTCGTFVGWTIGDYDNTAAPSPFYTAGAEMADITAPAAYKAVYRTASGAETLVTDNWTGAKTGVTTYATWTKTDASAATYQGYTAKNSTYSNCIQMKSADSNSGIITTASGGDAKKVTITWNSNTTSGRTVDVYGKKAAYSSAADLYSAGTQGTKIGSIVYGTSTELEIDGDYQYIGLRSNSSALYIDNIAIQWYGSPMHYMTSPTCNPMVGITESLSSFTYAYGAGPSASQSFTVSGSNLTNNVTVAAPANYEVCLTAAGTYSSSVSIAQVAGEIDNTTVYIRLKDGLNVGSYNGGVITVSSTGASDATSAALTGSVTKAAATMAFTPDVYEATYEGSPVIVNFMLTLNGDGTVAYSRSPAAGSRAVNTDGENTFTALQAGIWTITATHTPGDNYTKAANATATVRVKCVDTYVDFIHNKAVLTYGSGTPVTDGKMEDWGSGYTVPYVADESEATSGSCQTTHFKFVGWVSEDEINIVEGTFKPGYTLISAGTAGKTASTKTYYAVWAKLED